VQPVPGKESNMAKSGCAAAASAICRSNASIPPAKGRDQPHHDADHHQRVPISAALRNNRRLTEKTQEALQTAQSDAFRRGNQQVDVEHLLAAQSESGLDWLTRVSGQTGPPSKIYVRRV
jgi:hypothetical protein